jgi:organic radical activating enzyme
MTSAINWNEKYRPNNLDIQLDNYCDLKCIYCNEEFSSQWQSERERFGDIKNYIPIHSGSASFSELFFSWFDTVKMSFERIAFLGGEPLISPKFYQYLETVINSYRGEFPQNFEIYIITNLNTKEHYFNKFVKTIETYKDKIKFNINVSMESTDIRAETIRHGLDYDRFVSNFDRLAAIPEITITNITSLNVFCLSTLSEHLSLVTSLEKKYNRQIDIHENLVTWPQYLHINLMERDLGTKYVQDSVSVLKDTGHDSYVTFLNNLVDGFKFNELQNTPIHKNLKQELETLSIRRNINYQEIFNEYKYIWA